MSRPDTCAFDSEQEVRPETDGLVGAARVGGVSPVVDQRPLGRRATVVEGGLADDLDLDLAFQAFDGTNEHVVRVVVRGRPRVGSDGVLVVRRAYRQRVAHLDPARGGLPRRYEDVRPRFIRTRCRVVDPEGPEPEEAGFAVEQAPEDAGSVEARNAQPVDRPVGSDERARVAVGEEGVVLDRRERRRRGGTLRPSALRRRLFGHDSIQGSCQRPCPATRLLAASVGPHEPGL